MEENVDALTLIELGSKLRGETLLSLENGQFSRSESENKDSFPLALDSLISPENLNYISTPVKNETDQMGCNTPVTHLLSTFSPTVVQYLDQRENQRETEGNVFNFVEAMSPNTVDICFMASNYNNGYMSSYEDIKQQVRTNASEQKVERPRQFYPGSMFVKPEKVKHTDELPNLETYFTDLGEGREDMTTSVKYHDEVVNSSEQHSWQQMHSFNGIVSGNGLAPVMLSNHEQLAFLQRHIHAINEQTGMKSEDAYVLPVYFQPVMPVVSEQENQDTDEIVDSNPMQFLDQSNPNEREGINWMANQLLLNQSQMSLNSETQESRSLNSSKNMKYLEEAAVKLLQVDIKSLSSDNSQSPGRFVCNVCHRHFKRNFTLQTHQRTHTGDKPFACGYCGKRFRQSGTKLNHERAVHTKSKPFKCDFCDKSFSHKSTATVHRRTHTKEKPFECLQCNRKFTDRATYSKHQIVHSNIKPFYCPVCGNRFSQKSNLKRHFQNIHAIQPQNLLTAMSKEDIEALCSVVI